MFPLSLLLKSIVKHGHLILVAPNGARTSFGNGAGKAIVLRVRDKGLGLKLARNPGLAFGEAYMEGAFEVEGGDIYDLLDLLMANIGWSNGDAWSRGVYQLRMLARRLQQFNPAQKSQRNVAHHYDLSDALYDLFLDADRQYSCAYYLSPDDSLERAQAQKKRHLASKLLIKPDQKILDIGSGWGGLGLYLASLEQNIEVTGLTLSQEQHRVSNARAEAAGLGGRVRYHLLDYRKAQGQFDRIVSVGMFEHVGLNHYRRFFRAVADRLAPDGVAVLHSIGRADGPGVTNPWIRKYIFPGGYSPALSEVLPAIEEAGLCVTDIEILRLHYAETLRAWRMRFSARRTEAEALYDERFCRMWEFYLAACEATFRHAGHMVFQIQMAKRIDAVPLARDYMFEAESRLPLPLTPIAPLKQAQG